MTAELACVVIGYANQPGLEAAVRSLQAQDPLPEIVVVNSGGGGAPDTLRHLGVPVIERAERLFAGGARNVGIAATRAPYVAFLAGDCRAAPGWVAGRLREHLAGAGAVAGVVANGQPGSASAAAAQALLYRRCDPSVPDARRVLSGLSYDRRLLQRLGGFRGDLRSGEDTALNKQVAEAGVRVAFPADVRTFVSHPGRPGELIRDQYLRGTRTARAWQELGRGGRELQLAEYALRNARAAAGAVLRSSSGRRLRAALLLVPAGAVATAAGFLRWRFSAGPRRAPSTTTAPPPRGAPPARAA